MTIYDYIFFPSLFILLQFLSSIWIKTRLENSIRHEYERKLADYQNELKIRNRSEIIARLFAEWTSFPDDFKKLNQLTWEASLWLPDDIVKEIGKRLTNNENAKQVQEIIVEVRKLLLEKKDSKTTVVPDDIVYFKGSHR